MTKQTCASKSKVALNAAFAAILAVGLSVPAASAFAAPSDDKQAEAQAALQKLNQYQSELDQASANYEAAHQEQIDAQNRVDEAQKQIEEKTAQIEKDQQRLSDRARDMYRSGDTNFLDVILGASSFEQFATTWNMLETLNGNDAELVSETKTAREDLQAAKQEAEEQAKVASDKAEEAKSVAEAADQKASEMQQTYNSLSAEAQELISQERAAQEAQQQKELLEGKVKEQQLPSRMARQVTMLQPPSRTTIATTQPLTIRAAAPTPTRTMLQARQPTTASPSPFRAIAW